MHRQGKVFNGIEAFGNHRTRIHQSWQQQHGCIIYIVSRFSQADGRNEDCKLSIATIAMMLPDWSCCCLLREYALMILMSPPQTCRWFWQWRSDAFSTCNLTSGASTFHPSPGNLARVTWSVLTGKGRNHKKSKKMNTKAKTMEWKHALCSGWIAGQVFMIPKHYALLDKYFFWIQYASLYSLQQCRCL